jgi:hypothetical protein
VSAISRAIRRARVGLKNPNRPIASFIFAGPTGVGKSELAKTLASYYFGSEEAMVSAVMLFCHVLCCFHVTVSLPRSASCAILRIVGRELLSFSVSWMTTQVPATQHHNK